MPKTREEILEARRRLKTEYGDLYDSTAALLFRHDPIAITLGNINIMDEYEPEVGTILPRLRTCHSADDVCRIVHEEFVRWFSASIAGPQERYGQIAREIWDVWQRTNPD